LNISVGIERRETAVAGKIFAWNNTKGDRVARQRGTPANIGVSGVQKATRLGVSGMLLLVGAVSPAFAQVTMLNGDDALNPPNPPADVTTSVPTVSPPTNGAPNSLVVTGQVDKGETAPSINLDNLLSEQSGAQTTNKADEYVNPPGGGSREVGGAVGGLLDKIWQKE
jgi:hypothetical protein